MEENIIIETKVQFTVMLIVLIHFSGLKPPNTQQGHQSPAAFVETPQDPLKPFTLLQTP